MKECIDLGVANKTFNKCQEIFTTQGLKRHSKVCTGPYKEFYCPDCGEQCNSIKNVKKHQSKEHTWETAQSKELSKHWRKGHCWKGTSCKFSHVGHQKETSVTINKTSTRRVPACGNGILCEWLRKGSCSFFHPRVKKKSGGPEALGRQRRAPEGQEPGQPPGPGLSKQKPNQIQ